MADGTAGSTPGYPGDWARGLHRLLDGPDLRVWHGPDEPDGDEPWMREAPANDNDAAGWVARPGVAGPRCDRRSACTSAKRSRMDRRRGAMTEDQARGLLRAVDRAGGLETWIADQPWIPLPSGWAVVPRHEGRRFRIEPVPHDPGGLCIVVRPPTGGSVRWLVSPLKR
jgi:hypothetical protein